MVNKMDEASGSVKAFNRNDEQFLEAFAIFCGLGIQNTQMYETVERAMAKQEVTLEVGLTHTHPRTHVHYVGWKGSRRTRCTCICWCYYLLKVPHVCDGCQKKCS